MCDVVCDVIEWIVIWLIVVEVAIELIWNIFIKDILQLFRYNEADDE